MVVYSIITVLNNSELGGMSHVAFMRLRQETHKVQASLGYTGRLCLNKTKLGWWQYCLLGRHNAWGLGLSTT